MRASQIRVVVPALAPQQRWEKREGYGVTRCTKSTPKPNADASTKTRKGQRENAARTQTTQRGEARAMQGGRVAKKHIKCSQHWLTMMPRGRQRRQWPAEAATFNAQLGTNESRHWPAVAVALDAQPNRTLRVNNVMQWLLRFTPSSA